eukprot:164670_1
MQATLYFKVDSSRIRGDQSRDLWYFENPMDNINQNIFDIKNYANKFNHHFIHSRVDYMGYDMETKVIYDNRTKINGIIGHKQFPPTAAQHEQTVTPQDAIKDIQHIKKQISGPKKLVAVCRNIFYGIFIICFDISQIYGLSIYIKNI